MTTVYKKKCGCIFVMTEINKTLNHAKITYTVLCKAEEKERHIAEKLFGNKPYNNLDIKYGDLESAIKRGEVEVDIIETIKTMEEK